MRLNSAFDDVCRKMAHGDTGPYIRTRVHHPDVVTFNKRRLVRVLLRVHLVPQEICVPMWFKIVVVWVWFKHSDRHCDSATMSPVHVHNDRSL